MKTKEVTLFSESPSILAGKDPNGYDFKRATAIGSLGARCVLTNFDGKLTNPSVKEQ